MGGFIFFKGKTGGHLSQFCSANIIHCHIPCRCIICGLVFFFLYLFLFSTSSLSGYCPDDSGNRWIQPAKNETIPIDMEVVDWLKRVELNRKRKELKHMRVDKEIGCLELAREEFSPTLSRIRMSPQSWFHLTHSVSVIDFIILHCCCTPPQLLSLLLAAAVVYVPCVVIVHIL